MRKYLSTILTVLLTALLSVGSMHVYADQWGHEKAECFSAYEKSPGVYHFRVLVARKVSNSNHLWLSGAIHLATDKPEKGYGQIVFMQEGKPDVELIRFHSALTAARVNVTDNTSYGNLKNDFRLVQWDEKYGKAMPTSPIDYHRENGIVYYTEESVLKNGGEQAVFAEWDWYMPLEMVGKGRGKFRAIIVCKGANPASIVNDLINYSYDQVQDDQTYAHDLMDVVLPNTHDAQAPQLSQPMMAIDMGDGIAEPGQMLLPLISGQDKIYGYKFPDDATLHTLSEHPNNAMVYIPNSDKVRKNYKLNVQLIYNGELEKSTYEYYHRDVTYEHYNLYFRETNAQNIPAYHRIYNFQIGMHRDTADRNLSNGAIELKWKIAHPKETDICPTDIFEIQRASKSDFSDAETIGAVNYNSKPKDSEIVQDTLTYTYVDDSPEVKHGDGSETWHFYYRIRRASSSVWDWDEAGSKCDKLYQSGLAAKGEINQNGHCVSLTTFATSIYVDTVSDYSKSRNVKINYRFNQPYWGNHEQNSYYYDGTPLYVVKKMIDSVTGDTTVQELLIPKDSIHAVDDTWEIRYTFAMDVPCVHYDLSVRFDTTDCTLRLNRQRNYYYNSFVGQNNLPNKGFFTGGMRLDPDTLKSVATRDNPNGIFLRWSTYGGAFDSYIVERQTVGESSWKTLDTGLTDMGYEDHRSPVGKYCDYRIIGVQVCNGEYRDSLIIRGYRYEYGSIGGHVTMPNGMAYSGLTVRLDCDSLDVHLTQTTDSTGYYHFEHVLFNDEGIHYTVTPMSTNTFDNFGEPREVDLSGWSAEPDNINFTNKNAVRFTGRVLYENSTVPVANCHFLVNNRLAYNADGSLAKTDASGNFELMVPAGSTTVRGVMEGHTFVNDGYLIYKGDSLLPLTKPLDGVRLYDQTKVTVIGRVAGGTVQGLKPWGDVTSTNNLGDNLTMVFELEGDNISHLVDYNDPEKVAFDTLYNHPVKGQTHLTMTKKRVTVHPDSLTGEYRIDLYPVRWKLVQATADGHGSLLPSGKTSESLDLSNCVWPIDTIHQRGGLPYHRLNNIIYRSPISLTYNQLYYGMKVDYLGEQQLVYASLLNGGNGEATNLVLRDSNNVMTGYLLGHPVFISGAKYTYQIFAHEDYYYNNDRSDSRHEEVILKDKDVVVYNRMSKTEDQQTIRLDGKTGEGRVTVKVSNPTFVDSGEQALRQIEMQAEFDGQYVHAEPIRGFIVATLEKQGADAVVATASVPEIADIIRDPYGSTSSAYVETGTKYSSKCTDKVTVSGGVTTTISTGTNFEIFAGVAAPVGPFTGQVNTNSSVSTWSVPLKNSQHITVSHEYSYSLSDRISTSSDKLMVGAKADVYVGKMKRHYVARASSITLIDSAMYALKQPAFASGQMRLIASSDIAGKRFYLVTGENLLVNTTVDNAVFAYTQKHIVEVIIPELERQRDAMIYGMEVSLADLDSVARRDGKAQYRSLVSVDDPQFGFKYEKVDASGDGIIDNTDYVAQCNQVIAQWKTFIANNEKQKLEIANKGKLLHDYSISSGVTRSYSESAGHGCYNTGWVNDGFSAGFGYNGGNVYDGKDIGSEEPQTAKAKGMEIEFNVNVFGFKNRIKLTPNFDFNYAHDVSYSDTDCKSAGFTLSMSTDGYEDIAVYRLTDNSFTKDGESDRKGSTGPAGGDEPKKKDYLYADYVYVRRGGATRCPYEAEEKTLYYKPGTTLAPATVQIDKPHIELSTREIDNVPADQAATILVTISNQSTYNGSTVYAFNLCVDEQSNPNGLRLSMDGAPMSGNRQFLLTPGQSIQKVLTVERGVGYDFENIRLQLIDDCQATLSADAEFTVRFDKVSCPVTMALPVQNWLMNTLSPQDKKGNYYIPVEITGYNVEYEDFDHIEVQYKLSTESDDQWVTLCSYYADSTYMRLASGEKKMIEGATIRGINFYGERDPMEQEYDLRAVSFCRFGTGYITRSSEVKHGIKDTRAPQLFGAATPANGLLRVGDYISIPFSEPIAANYLDEDNNFQITGYTNSASLTSTASLYFDGSKKAYASTELTRSLSDRDFTFDLLVCPATMGKHMTYMMHGSENSYVSLGQRYIGKDKGGRDRCCLAMEMFIGSQSAYVESDTLPLSTNWMRVAAVYHAQTGHVTFYCGTDTLKTNPQKSTLPAHYTSTGRILLGSHPALSEQSDVAYRGNMLEVRLWNEALNTAKIANTNMTYLTGYEQGLVAYYPLNEGHSNYAEDLASGARMYMKGLSWSLPEGKSMHLNGKTLLLDGNAFASTSMNDYTLTFWFREERKHMFGQTVSLFRSGDFYINLTQQGVQLHQNTFDETAHGEYMDGEWHHFALSVNRSTGTSAMYLDGKSVLQFRSSLIGAPGANVVEIGPMSGYVDDFTFWELALPGNYLSKFYGRTPNDDEWGLKTHLCFSERKLNDSGIYETVYNPYNCRHRYDQEGKLLARTEDDKLVLSENAEEMADVNNAPVNEKGDLTKMNFNWIGRDNELVINLKMLDKEINKQNIFITVRDVEDLHGNPLASPLTWTLFVDRNQLRWSNRYVEQTLAQGTAGDIQVDIINEGGTSINYLISGLPWWLSVAGGVGELSPQEQLPVRLTISDQLDAGDYDETIYLTDDRGLSEPLRVHITVEPQRPDWTIDRATAGQETMGLFAQVGLDGAYERRYYPTDERDLVAAFVGATCVGIQNIRTLAQSSMVIMTLYGNNNEKTGIKGKTINFLYWQASTGRIYSLQPESGNISFNAMTVVGTPEAPIQLLSSELMTQQIAVREGWNWVSFYLDPITTGGNNFSVALTGQYEFTAGDLVGCGARFMDFTKRPGQKGTWNGQALFFQHQNVYQMHLAHEGKIGVIGKTLDAKQCQVRLAAGWNNLPYLLSTSQDLTTALADYYDYAEQGDIIKSYDAFAMYSPDMHAWIGSLTHMHPGEGYMFFRSNRNADTVTLRYQTSQQPAKVVRRNVATHVGTLPTNLPMVLTLPNAKVGERLQALLRGEVIAEAQADEMGRFWMLISADEQSAITFRYMAEDGSEAVTELVAYTSSVASIGTADAPHVLTLSTTGISAYPSPYVDYITFAAEAQRGESVEVSLYDAVGHCLWQHSEIATQSGMWTYTLGEAEAYMPGVYWAVIRVANVVKQVKLIKE